MALNETKKPWYLSKTLWLQVLGIVALIVPASAEFIKEYFSEVGMGWALINMILRLVSKDQIEISMSSFKVVLVPLLFAVAACGAFGDKEEEETSGPKPYPDASRVCVQITEANKEQMTLEMGRSCKVGDFLSKGAPTCSSTLDKCMYKVY